MPFRCHNMGPSVRICIHFLILVFLSFSFFGLIFFSFECFKTLFSLKRTAKKNFIKKPTLDFKILGSIAKGNTTYFFRPYQQIYCRIVFSTHCIGWESSKHDWRNTFEESTWTFLLHQVSKHTSHTFGIRAFGS